MSETPESTIHLEPISAEEALASTCGEFHDFLRDHPGQTYIVHRTSD